ncbi:lipoprotein [Canicola haemoglobinophilus]|uniref:Lipoprotein n=1 Tax=Canicola haemoglobinophilus TaxID=733 RepID=A0AB38H891_9PAST|nr:NlpC/P60 family protein [Canicola haemoglobinophilus]STO53949.1 lipoprotein [Canicola haemoglobinophilus]STO68482.1 lipoprotein [Canicola haemoglobinophilus]
MLKKISFCISIIILTACTSTTKQKNDSSIEYQGKLNDPIMAIALLSEQQHQWAGTPYLIGGNTRRGIDCSAFVQKTFKDRFNVKLPRTTVEQAKQGIKIKKTELQTGDLVFFRTGRGPNGYHVGIYVKDDQFLHASTKGGVIYSSLNSPYWKRTYWQARRL